MTITQLDTWKALTGPQRGGLAALAEYRLRALRWTLKSALKKHGEGKYVWWESAMNPKGDHGHIESSRVAAKLQGLGLATSRASCSDAGLRTVFAVLETAAWIGAAAHDELDFDVRWAMRARDEDLPWMRQARALGLVLVKRGQSPHMASPVYQLGSALRSCARMRPMVDELRLMAMAARAEDQAREDEASRLCAEKKADRSERAAGHVERAKLWSERREQEADASRLWTFRFPGWEGGAELHDLVVAYQELVDEHEAKRLEGGAAKDGEVSRGH